ncbi:MAG: hypothetical protein ACYTHK_16080 [Planctomycetota bacterium]|jgi:hypothetical protein
MPSDKTKKTRGAAGDEKQDRRILPERRAAKERRSGADRRKEDRPVAVEHSSGKDRNDNVKSDRRKVERRINEYPLKAEVLEFINAINEFKSVNQKPFPTWTEIYEIFVGLGYRKPD